MPLLVKLRKVSAKMLAAILMTVVAIYLLLLLTNLKDQPPSAAANTLQQLLISAKPAVEQTAANNGYLYLAKYDKPAKYRLAEPLTELLRQCETNDCNAVLKAQTNLPELVAQHQPLSDFYQQLLSVPYWYQPIPSDTTEALPSFFAVYEGQQLLLLQAWLAAQQHDLAKVTQLLQQDLQFWRTFLVKNNLLINKLISGAAIKRHFNFAAHIKQQLAPEQASAILPQAWLNAFTEPELSLQLVIATEWAYSNVITETVILKAPQSSSISFSEQLEWYLLTPLLQPQASSNQLAATLLAYVNGKSPDTTPWYSWLYNPVGKILNSVTQPNYQRYFTPFAELETLRQQTIAVSAASSRQ